MKKRFTSLNDLLMSANRLLLAVSFAMIYTILSSTVTSAQGIWIKNSDFPGWTRYSAASFSIGTKGYIVIGEIEADTSPTREFWEWDQVTNVWTRKADFPGKIAIKSVSFSIGTKGYIGSGSGYDDDIGKYGSSNKFWEYDPETNSWTQKASLPITPAREGAVGFSIGTKGYIGTGKKDPFTGVNFPDPNYKDFWEWDQTTNVWTRKTDFPGMARYGAVGFSIGNKGYIGTGWGDNNLRLKDFWEWDQTTDVWIKKADFGGFARAGAVNFSIGNKGYIGTGWGDNNLPLKDFWEWDQVTNEWIKNSDFGGPSANAFGSFTIGGNGYMAIGADFITNTFYHELWNFVPSAITGLKEVVYENNFFYPNPASDIITLNPSHPGFEDMTLNIYNVSGELINSRSLRHNQQKINIEELNNGMYIVEIKSKDGSERQKLIVQR